MDKALNSVRDAGRGVMRVVAKGLNKVTKGKLEPDVVTMVGFMAHVPIACLIATNNLLIAGILLIIFGLFDTLDGELARLQNRASARGMFLDSVTDRLKEVMLYIGAGYLFVDLGQPFYAVWAIAAIGFSVAVSYVNAWGEVVLSKHTAPASGHQQNKTFRSGLLTYDIRILLLVIGLVFGVLQYVVVIITLLSLVTIVQRTSLVLKKLS